VQSFKLFLLALQTQNIFMSKFGSYIQEAYDELVHKVTWPTWDELQQTTVIVLVALAITTLIMLGMNVASEKVITLIYNLLGN
jgi:preprotein translocase subunit SecE